MKPSEAISILEMILDEASKWGLDERMEACDIAINAIEENEQLKAKLDDWRYEAQCHMDEVVARDKKIEQLMERINELESEVEGAENYREGLEAFIRRMKDA